MSNEKHYPLHPNQSHPPIMTCEIPLEEYESLKRENAELKDENERMKRVLMLARAKRAKEAFLKWNLFPNFETTNKLFTIDEYDETPGATDGQVLRTCEGWYMVWKSVERKCLKKAEEYYRSIYHEPKKFLNPTTQPPSRAKETKWNKKKNFRKVAWHIDKLKAEGLVMSLTSPIKIDIPGVGSIESNDLYLKSEADKVIADLEESHKKEVEQLLMEIVELKKEKEYVIEHTAEVINGQERELRRQKYKRCLAMARWCASRSASWCLDPADEQLHKSEFYDKWKHRWLEIAEKFKEAK